MPIIFRRIHHRLDQANTLSFDIKFCVAQEEIHTEVCVPSTAFV
jgi:hypothetical protein